MSDETLKQRVSLLRRALGQDANREYIQTVRGFGYRLGVEPIPVDEPDAPEQKANTEAGTTGAGNLAFGLFGGTRNLASGLFGDARLLRHVLLTLAIVALLLAITVLAVLLRQAKRWPGDFATTGVVEVVAMQRLWK